MRKLEVLKLCLYVWYIGGSFATAFLVGVANSITNDYDGTSSFGTTAFFTTLALSLFGGVPFILIFIAVERTYLAHVAARDSNLRQQSEILARLKELTGTAGTTKSDDADPSSGPGGRTEELVGSAAVPSHLIYQQDPTDDEREINTRPFPKR
ncbi:hypothetical protein [Demequina oxidasica]|uniref:hypothetical protein n=1 Tax=Demequina oxidasica TaxID=676199 RepID=UPI000AF00567|nr:hypothetical protein [Demequina oxidasica]